MYATLYKNKWQVLAFVVLVLVGAQYFVGSWREERGQTDAKVGPIEREADGNGLSANSGPPTEMSRDQEAFDEEDAAFLSDEELIDSAEGFDPTPVEDNSFDEEDDEDDGDERTGTDNSDFANAE